MVLARKVEAGSLALRWTMKPKISSNSTTVLSVIDTVSWAEVCPEEKDRDWLLSPA